MNNSVYWYTTWPKGDAISLARDVSAQVVVVGGGMAGLIAALTAVKAGKKVILLEASTVGSGASGKTSGFITPDSEIELSSLLETYGPEKARRFWEFVKSGVELIRETISAYDIKCDYRVQDSFLVARNSSGFDHVLREHKGRKDLGYPSMLHDRSNISSVLGSDRFYGGVRYPETFGINSYQFCRSMLDVLMKLGVSVFENSRVTDIKDHFVIANGFKVGADKIIVTTDFRIPELGDFDYQLYHVQTFLAMTESLPDSTIKMLFPDDWLMVWDTDLIYQYFRLVKDNRLLIGGADIRYTYASDLKQNTQTVAKYLVRALQKKFQGIELPVSHCWPGMLGVTKDLLPLFRSSNKSGVSFVGAASGLPWAAALGRLAAIEPSISEDERFIIHEFRPERRFVFNRRMQALVGKKVAYSLSHGYAKYGNHVLALLRDTTREIIKLL